MKELNELTRRLLAEGYTPEDTPPGTCEYKSYYGGWTYTSEAQYRGLRMVILLVGAWTGGRRMTIQ